MESRYPTSLSPRPRRRVRLAPLDPASTARWSRRVVWFITLVLAANQLMIRSLAPHASGASPGSSFIGALLGIQTAAATTIIGPQLNPDGKTTSLAEQPTISAVPANPRSGDDLADAKAVMLGHGKPDYAPEGASFDDPVRAQNVWGSFEGSIQLSGADLERYNRLINAFLCNYCCGEALSVTRNRQCACAHAKAARGYFKYMVKTYGDRYSDEQLMGEGHRWQAVWYPRGAVADYLLAIGKSAALPHQPHGGAGTDGLHGLGGQ